MKEKKTLKFGKKSGLSAAMAVAVALVVCVGCISVSQNSAASAASKSITQSATSSSTAYISQAKALYIAYAHAGVNAADILKSEVELDSKKAPAIYEVEFETSTKKGEYEIDATTGEILDYEVKLSSSGSSVSSASYIGEAAAKEAALGHAGISAEDVLKMETELDSDGGVMIYKVEFETSTQKGEYHIDACTGEVLRFRVETKGSGTTESSSSSSGSESSSSSMAYIGGDAAQAAALAHAGVSESSTVYLKWYYKYNNGKPVNYCVEFGAGSTKYVYIIDLYSGDVVQYNTYPFYSHNH